MEVESFREDYPPLRARRALRLPRDRSFSILGVLLILSATAPLWLGPYGTRVATTVFMYVALAQAWDLVGGYAGLISLAHPAFFGTGAVVAAVLLSNGVPLFLAVLAALVASIIIALVTGIPTLRLRGHYFVVATILVTEGLRNFVLNFDGFGFHGGIAINVVQYVGLADLGAADYNLVFFFVMLALAFIGMLLIIGLGHSRWGYALQAMRDSQEAAEALGIASTKLKIVVFIISGALTSLVGSAWAFWLGTVSTDDAYGLVMAFEIIVMVFLGGRGSVWGPPIGVVVMIIVNEIVGVEFSEVTQIISGLMVMAIVLFLPDGLVRVVVEGPAALSPSRLRANLMRYSVR